MQVATLFGVQVLQIHQCESPGDILLFLTGEQEIEDACNRIRKAPDWLAAILLFVTPPGVQEAASLSPDLGQLDARPLYSTLPPQLQQRIFDPAPGATTAGGAPGRKVRGLVYGLCVHRGGRLGCCQYKHCGDLAHDRWHRFRSGPWVFKAEGILALLLV